jgi:hypothetical protein
MFKPWLFPLAKRLPRPGPVTPLGRARLAAWCLLLLLLGGSQAALVVLPRILHPGPGEAPSTPAPVALFEPERPEREGLPALPAATGLHQVFNLERYQRLGRPAMWPGFGRRCWGGPTAGATWTSTMIAPRS